MITQAQKLVDAFNEFTSGRSRGRRRVDKAMMASQEAWTWVPEGANSDLDCGYSSGYLFPDGSGLLVDSEPQRFTIVVGNLIRLAEQGGMARLPQLPMKTTMTCMSGADALAKAQELGESRGWLLGWHQRDGAYVQEPFWEFDPTQVD